MTFIWGLVGVVIGSIMLLYGLYGAVKKKIYPTWTIFISGNRYAIDASRNKPFFSKSAPKDYLIYGTWAVIEGIVYIVMGIIVIYASIRSF